MYFYEAMNELYQGRLIRRKTWRADTHIFLLENRPHSRSAFSIDQYSFILVDQLSNDWELFDPTTCTGSAPLEQNLIEVRCHPPEKPITKLFKDTEGKIIVVLDKISYLVSREFRVNEKIFYQIHITDVSGKEIILEHESKKERNSEMEKLINLIEGKE